MNDTFARFIAVAKHTVYNRERANTFLPMLDTRMGSIQAVLSVIAAIEKQRPIPIELVGMLAVNVYLMMVDVAMSASGEKPVKEIMKQTMSDLMDKLKGGYVAAKPAMQQAKPQTPPAGGLLAGAQ